MPKPRVLRVYVNPYTYIDSEGRPAGVYSHDPGHMPGQMHVGITRLQTTVTEKRDPKKDDRASLTDLVHHYDAEVQEVPDIPGQKHYRDGIREGSLIPADEATARAVGMKFEDPQEVLGRARLKAVREWTDANGEPPAFAADDDAHAHVPMGLRGPEGAAWAKDMAAAQPAMGRPEALPQTTGTGDALPEGHDPFPTDEDARRARDTEKGDR